MTLDERRLMDEMSRSILMTRAEIGLRSGFSKDKTMRILNALASRGLVAREGAGRGTRYRRVWHLDDWAPIGQRAGSTPNGLS